ncbi:hypothetical protein FC789_02250 [Clostridium botulinum]|nr:hypothetical protein [Clostridium botulinum]NFG40023.1 hypothetical protein [Clostridium botulinum]
MKLTSNYSLKKPDGSDVVNVQDFNDNSDKIDLELKNVESSLKDCAKDIQDLSNIKIDKKVKYYTSDDVARGASPDNILAGSFLIAHNANPVPRGFCYYEQFFYGEISEKANRIQYVTSYNGDLRHFIRRYFDGVWDVIELATTETTILDFPYDTGWTDIADSSKQYSKIIKQSSVVNLLLNARASTPITERTKIGTLPVGYRPNQDIAVASAVPHLGTELCVVNIFGSGDVLITPIKQVNSSITFARGGICFVATH